MNWILDAYFFALFLIVSLVLIIVGFLKNHSVLVILSGIFFMLLGVLLWSGLSYERISYLEDTNSTVTSVGYTDQDWNVKNVNVYAFTFELVGIFLIFAGGLDYKRSLDSNGQEDDDE